MDSDWHLTLGLITIAVIFTLIPVAAYQAMRASVLTAKRYWTFSLFAFIAMAIGNIAALAWILDAADDRAVTLLQFLGLMMALLFALACRIGFESTVQIARLRDRLTEGEANLRHYQRNLENLVERRTNALRSEVARRQEIQARLQRNVEDIEADLRLARDLQLAMLPRLPRLPFCDCAVWQRPVAEVSGDTYVFHDDGNALSIFVGDAMGHGVSAALLTSFVHAGVHQLTDGRSGAEVMHALNEQMAREKIDAFTTGVHLSLNSDGELDICSAGSPEVLLVSGRDHGLTALPGEGLPLGLLEDLPEPYAVQQTRLSDGDRIVIFTDGLYEWRNADNEMFGLDRLRDSVRELGAQSLAVEAFGEALIARLVEFAGEREANDDYTLVVADYRVAESALS